MKLLTTLLLLFISAQTYACRPSLNGIRWSIENATDVYVGHVTGYRNLSFENSLRENKDSELIQIPSLYKMRVFVAHSLLGKAETVVETNSTLCKDHYSIREKVYVFNNAEDEYSFAISEDDFKANFEELFKKFSNKAQKKDADKNSAS